MKKVSGIILILINGLQTIRSWIFMYYDLHELVCRKKNV